MKKVLTFLLTTILGMGMLSAATTRIYCKNAQAWWLADGAGVNAHCFLDNDNKMAEWPGTAMTAVDGEENMWYIDVDITAYPNIVFVRSNGTEFWGAQTEDLVIPTDGRNLYTITSTTAQWMSDGHKVTGEWSEYGKTHVYAKSNWAGAEDWTWKELILNEVTSRYELADLVYGGAGMNIDTKMVDSNESYLDNDAITAANGGVVVAKFDTIMLSYDLAIKTLTVKVTGKYVAPVDPETYNTLRFVPNVWANDGAKIAAWIWGENLDGQFTTFFEGEGDTLSVKINTKADSIIFVRFNSALTEPKWNTELEKENEWNRIEKMKINTESLVYTITDWAAGTWDVYTPETPAKFYIVGNEALMGVGKGWKLEYAVKVTENSYTFTNLAAGDYALKALTALDWDKSLGFSALSEKSEGLDADKDDNITFTLAEAGDVVVTYIAGENITYTVTGKFYVKPVEPDTYNTLRFVPNVWANDGAKIAAWIWGENLDGQFTTFFEGEGDTLSVKINTKADSIIFVRFNSALTEPKWNNEYEKENEWTRIDKMKINTESLVFTITGWTAGTWDVFTRVDYILNNAGELANDGAKLFVHTWGDNMADEDILMTEVKDGDAVVGYKAAINTLTQYLVFVRMNPEAEAIDWSNNWGKSADLVRCESNNAYFTGWSETTINVSCDAPTDVETVEQPNNNGKVIENGILYILRDGKRYNAQGVEVK